MQLGLSGGDILRVKLEEIKRKVGDGEVLRLGYLENATYPDGTPVAYVASIQEWGATVTIQPREATIYRQIGADGSFAKGGKFVRKDKANYATTHAVEAYTVVIPPRPSFRRMIANKSPGWGTSMAKVMKAADCDVNVAFARMGEGIKGQLQASIRDFSSPPLAKSTIAKKGFSQPLVDTGHMLNSVDYEVKGGS